MPTKAPADIYRHVDEVYPDTRTLAESAETVEAMLGQPGYQAVRKLIGVEVESIDRKLDHAPLREASEYAHAHGRRSALLAFEDGAHAIIERAQQRVAADQEEIDAGESASGR